MFFFGFIYCSLFHSILVAIVNKRSGKRKFLVENNNRNSNIA